MNNHNSLQKDLRFSKKTHQRQVEGKENRPCEETGLGLATAFLFAPIKLQSLLGFCVQGRHCKAGVQKGRKENYFIINWLTTKLV